jgi:hypothetical protein
MASPAQTQLAHDPGDNDDDHIAKKAATIVTAGAFAILYLAAYATGERWPLRRKNSLEYRAHLRHWNQNNER